MVYLIIVGGLIAYLIGSIPTSVWYGKATQGIDIRDYGSGNAGATNTFRTLGKKAGIFVMVIDIFKGFVATSLAYLFVVVDAPLSTNQLIVCQLIYGFLAVVGHIFPVYERFKGGKGVASLLGMVLAVNTPAALICVVIFLIVFVISKYVSLGSMIAALSFPILLLMPKFNHDQPNPFLIGFGFLVFMLVVVTHKKNIRRLINGEENKTNLKLAKNRG